MHCALCVSTPTPHSASALREALKDTEFIIAVVFTTLYVQQTRGLSRRALRQLRAFVSLTGLCFLCITAYHVYVLGERAKAGVL